MRVKWSIAGLRGEEITDQQVSRQANRLADVRRLEAH